MPFVQLTKDHVRHVIGPFQQAKRIFVAAFVSSSAKITNSLMVSIKLISSGSIYNSWFAIDSLFTSSCRNCCNVRCPCLDCHGKFVYPLDSLSDDARRKRLILNALPKEVKCAVCGDQNEIRNLHKLVASCRARVGQRAKTDLYMFFEVNECFSKSLTIASP